MKISKGTVLECTIAVLILLSCLLDIKNYWFTIPFGIASILTIIDCLRKWFKTRNNDITEEVECISKLKKNIFISFFVFSLLVNFLLFYSTFTLNDNNQKLKEEKECYKLDFNILEKNCTNFHEIEFEVDENGEIIKNFECNEIKLSDLKKIYKKQIEKCK